MHCSIYLSLSYKMKMDAMRRKPGRPSKENCAPMAHNFDGKKNREIIAKESGESPEKL